METSVTLDITMVFSVPMLPQTNMPAITTEDITLAECVTAAGLNIVVSQTMEALEVVGTTETVIQIQLNTIVL